MSKKATEAKRVQERSHNDPKSYFARYQKEAITSESVETLYPHLNAAGLPWLLTQSTSQLPDTFEGLREELIRSRMLIKNELHMGGAKVGEWMESREEAEQKVDLQMGIWPTSRMLCCATAGQLRFLEEKFGRATVAKAA